MKLKKFLDFCVSATLVTQDVEKNKAKNMRPLWEAAKKTVDGGISDLKTHIEEKRRRNEDEQTILKLEVLERDLTIISMVSRLCVVKILNILLCRGLTCTSAAEPMLS